MTTMLAARDHSHNCLRTMAPSCVSHSDHRKCIDARNLAPYTVPEDVVQSYNNSQVRRGVHADIDAFVILEQTVLTDKDVLDEIKRLIAKYRRNGRAYKDWNKHRIEDDRPQISV
ncbi:hypothetical protein CONPUDRAFT_85256 [Coniophora puteana RWD-64-598 SS2]|uniref:Uncharacterized protein n=1 Tax=Coniophora puteana (strain RWD-64-598) TaxID=741705 RepID=A0A5M3M991_CONPW|nr:uncharacterized protein CONPUDRAFT_85256 [Coniophora puteana RWD-64-598 SS2]EIW75424.1 hypothetical protein CONPUDRAFT_85256 [Coniophora puteana RWD-64-598 SS2]